MAPQMVAPKLLSWASDIEANTIEQAARTARLPFIEGHVALMSDAHFGYGSTVGSVIPTMGAIVPSFAGVDLGCGLIVSETDLTSDDLPDNLDELMALVEDRIPAGVGKGHRDGEDSAGDDLFDGLDTELNDRQIETAVSQFGSLGSGNHFVEVCLDERDRVWTMLHSGSRGIGNQLATKHINDAKKLAKAWFIPLEDPDCAYLVQGTSEFKAYIKDMLWAQKYALNSRAAMAAEVTRSLFEVVGRGAATREINAHHNFTQQEHHHGKDIWVTRKGAIKAALGDDGVIPGSMGTRSYIVTGLGNPASYNSCSHGAGRRMGRKAAERTFTVESLAAAMDGMTWNSDKADQLLDEHPSSYKNIDQVMADQADLVSVQHTLRQVFNYKGTN